MAKRLEGAGASRLSSGGDRSGAPKLRSLDYTRKRNKGFRMKPRDIARLEELVERVGEATGATCGGGGADWRGSVVG